MLEGIVILTSLIFGIIGVAGVMIGMLDENSKSSWIGGTSLIIAMILLGLTIYGTCILEEMPYEREPEPYVVHKLMSLNDSSAISGRFYARRGYINEDMVYTYSYKTVSGAMKVQRVKTDLSLVYFTDNITPCAKWYHESKSWLWLTQTRETCDLYLPSGTLVESYKIDLN